MKYYVIEFQTREDGEINTSITQRSSFASGLSLYYERKSKMIITELYPSVSIMLVDENLTVIEQETIDTQYVQKATEEATE